MLSLTDLTDVHGCENPHSKRELKGIRLLNDCWESAVALNYGPIQSWRRPPRLSTPVKPRASPSRQVTGLKLIYLGLGEEEKENPS